MKLPILNWQFTTLLFVSRVLDKNQKFWYGSQIQIEFDNNLDENSTTEQPKGIVVQRDAKAATAPWAVEAFDKRNSFVCEFPPDDIGCISDDDLGGSKYFGSASFDKDGMACLPWSQSGSNDLPENHNQCRNPGGEADRPYCYIQVRSQLMLILFNASSQNMSYSFIERRAILLCNP